MRYGLISNYRRSWSIKGKRTELRNQMTYANRYLYSAVAPLSGKNFHLIGFSDADSYPKENAISEVVGFFNDKKKNLSRYTSWLEESAIYTEKIIDKIKCDIQIRFSYYYNTTPNLEETKRQVKEIHNRILKS